MYLSGVRHKTSNSNSGSLALSNSFLHIQTEMCSYPHVADSFMHNFIFNYCSPLVITSGQDRLLEMMFSHYIGIDLFCQRTVQKMFIFWNRVSTQNNNSSNITQNAAQYFKCLQTIHW